MPFVVQVGLVTLPLTLLEGHLLLFTLLLLRNLRLLAAYQLGQVVGRHELVAPLQRLVEALLVRLEDLERFLLDFLLRPVQVRVAHLVQSLERHQLEALRQVF